MGIATPALAINECGPVVANTVTCVPGTYPNGVIFNAGTPTAATPFIFNIGGAGQTVMGDNITYEASQYPLGSVIGINGPLTMDGVSTFFSLPAANHPGPLQFKVNGDVTLQNAAGLLVSSVAGAVSLDISGNVTTADTPGFNAIDISRSSAVTINATGNLSFKTQLDPIGVFPFFTGRTGFRLINLGSLNFTSTGAFNLDATGSGGYGLYAGIIAGDVTANITNFSASNQPFNTQLDTGGLSFQDVTGAVNLTSTGLLTANRDVLQLLNVGSANINVHDLISDIGYAIEVGRFQAFGTRTGPVNFTSTGLVKGTTEFSNVQGGNVNLRFNQFEGAPFVSNLSNGSVDMDFNTARITGGRFVSITHGGVAIDGGSLTTTLGPFG